MFREYGNKFAVKIGYDIFHSIISLYGADYITCLDLFTDGRGFGCIGNIVFPKKHAFYRSLYRFCFRMFGYEFVYVEFRHFHNRPRYYNRSTCLFLGSFEFLIESLFGYSALVVSVLSFVHCKFKQFFGMKAKMLAAEDVERLTGHAIGGVCPFGNPDSVKVYLDTSMKRFETVFPAAGSGNSAVEMTCDELEQASEALEWIDVCK